MAKVRAMFVGHGPSNLPEDRIVNTFHFNDASAYGVHQLQIVNALTRFYSGDPSMFPGVSNPVGAYLSPWVQRSAEFRLYDLDTAKPRVPYIVAFTLPPAFSGSGLPEEVACCLSYSSSFAPFSARRRGRIYFGPLSVGAGEAGTVSIASRPGSLMVNDLCASAQGLAFEGALGWAIRSTRPTENFVQIGRGWVDNAFDTQRRRGPDTTARTVWNPPVG